MDHPFNYLWQGVVTIGTLVLGWLHLSHRNEVKDMKAATTAAHKRADEAAKDAAAVQRSLDAHRLWAAENFARKTDVEAAMTKAEERQQLQFDRVFDLLDDIRDRLPPKQN